MGVGREDCGGHGDERIVLGHVGDDCGCGGGRGDGLGRCRLRDPG